ncbi:hypothetical protein F0562_022564 [Nyssa sinensis]|uniref:Uncharacterized protein n=1 Tax=Nyssa sinensis TaxID=561372 RepID=A0A5J5BS53_9ASTE|nr:hypothetical protein F0562_022564 [Nyssa sinensis]
MTGDKSLVSHLEKYNGRVVTFADGSRSGVLGNGSILLEAYCSQGVTIYTLDMVRELSRPFTRRTLMQFERHVGLVAADDMEADTDEGDGVVLDKDYLKLSTQRVHIQVIHERQDKFATSPSAMVTKLYSLILDDEDDDDDNDNGDDGDFTLDTSTV